MVCVSSHCIIMAVCVLYMTIKEILTLTMITVVHSGVTYDCVAVQCVHPLWFCVSCVINNDDNPWLQTVYKLWLAN